MSFLASALSMVALVILGFTSALHFYWALGGRRMSQNVIPVRRDGSSLFSPSAAAATFVAVALGGAALLIVAASGVLSLPLEDVTIRVLLQLGAGVFLVRCLGDFHYVGWAKRVRDTDFARADDRIYTPLCLLIALGMASAQALMLS